MVGVDQASRVIAILVIVLAGPAGPALGIGEAGSLMGFDKLPVLAPATTAFPFASVEGHFVGDGQGWLLDIYG